MISVHIGTDGQVD